MEALGALRRQGDVTRIELTGLDDNGVASLMEAAAGHALDRIAVDLARAVWQETDGNPFFVGEVLRHLSETGAIYQDPTGKWTTDQGLDVMVLPDSVREVIRARVVRLGEGSERVLCLAAVIGRDFDVDLWSEPQESQRTTSLTSLTPPSRWPLSVNWLMQPAGTTFRTPSFNTPSTKTLGRPDEQGLTEQWPRRSKTCAGDGRAPEWVNSPAIGSMPLSPTIWSRRSTIRAKRVTLRLSPSLQMTRCATTPRPSV